jgi:hypothetical protein
MSTMLLACVLQYVHVHCTVHCKACRLYTVKCVHLYIFTFVSLEYSTSICVVHTLHDNYSTSTMSRKGRAPTPKCSTILQGIKVPAAGTWYLGSEKLKTVLPAGLATPGHGTWDIPGLEVRLYVITCYTQRAHKSQCVHTLDVQ